MNEAAAALAAAAGLDVVMDRCVKIEHARLFGGLQLGRRQHRRDLGAPPGLTRRTVPTRHGRPPLPARDAGDPRRPDPRRRDRRARAADLPDDELRLRQRRPRREPVQPADLRQRLFAAVEPDRRGARGARRRARRRPRRAGVGERHGGRGDGAADPAPAAATTSSPPARSTAAASACWRSTSRKLGIETTFVDAASTDAFAAAMRPNTRAVFAESLGNPSLAVLDIAAVAEVAHAHGVPLVVDNTVPSPFLCNPIRFGADIVVHSATKYLGGHGTTLGGVMVESGKLPVGQRQVPGHDRAVAGLPRRQVLRDLRRLRLHDARAHGDAARLRRRARADERVADPAGRRDAAAAHGAALRQRARGRAIPARRTRASAGSTIPGLPDHPQHALVARQMRASAACRARRACSPSASRAASPAGVRFIEAAQFMSHLANIGDTRTLIIHPASTTHRQLDDAQQLAAGVPPDMVRISVGLEHIDDILWDIDQALAARRSARVRLATRARACHGGRHDRVTGDRP